MRETLETTGTAMLFTSVVLGSGFLIFTLAYMKDIATFGVLCSFASAAAFLADVTLAPALMVLVTRRARGPRGRSRGHPPADSRSERPDLAHRGPAGCVFPGLVDPRERARIDRASRRAEPEPPDRGSGP